MTDLEKRIEKAAKEEYPVSKRGNAGFRKGANWEHDRLLKSIREKVEARFNESILDEHIKNEVLEILNSESL